MEKKLNVLVDKVVELFGETTTDSIRQGIKQVLKEAYELGYRAEFDNEYSSGYAHAMTDLEESGKLK